MIETSIEHRLIWVESRRLLQITRLQVTPIDDVTRVVPLMPSQNRQQRRLARSVLGNQPHSLTLGNRKRYVLEQHLSAKRLRQILYVNIRIRQLSIIYYQLPIER